MKNNPVFKAAIKKAKEEGKQEGVKFTIKNYSYVLLLCLKDKFDFSTEELQEITEYINDTFDSINEGYLSLEDIQNVLEEENDMDVRFQKEYCSNDSKITEEFYSGVMDRTPIPYNSGRYPWPEEVKAERIKFYEDQLKEWHTEFEKPIIDLNPARRDQLINILTHSDGKEDLEWQLRKAGYLDE